jgi:hypothetical protein
MVCHKVNDLAFPLHASLHGHHESPEDDAALAFVKRRPDDEVGDRGANNRCAKSPGKKEEIR